MNQPSDSSNDSNHPSKLPAGDDTSPGSEGAMDREEAANDAAMIRKAKATIRRAEKILAFGIAQENEHLRASEPPRQRARACAKKGDLVGAEVAWREVIAAEEKTGDAAFIAKAHLHFGHWLLHVGRNEAAFDNSVRLVAVARRAGFSFVLWIALEQRVACALRIGRMAPALEAAEEAVQLAQNCEDLSGHRGWAHVLRGTCMLEFGDVARAEEDLEAGRDDTADQPGVKIPLESFHWLIRWWELAAGIRMEQRDIAGCAEAWEKIVLLRRALFNHRKESWYRLVDALLDWADVLRIDGQPDEADAAEAEADRLEAEFDVSDASAGDMSQG